MPVTAIFITACAGVFGLVIGSFLNVVAYRVPAGIPLTRESRCPRCAASIRAHQNIPVVSWLVQRGRCANCRGGISARYPLIELITGALFIAVVAGTQAQGSTGWATSPVFWGELIMLVLFAALSVVLTAIDLDVKRLPNVIVLPGWASVVVILAVATALDTLSGTPSWEPFIRAVLGGAALFLFYFVVRLISPRGMGGGDVKLAGLVGTVLGWFGWGALVVGAFAAFVLGGVVGIALIVIRRAGRKTAIPFGPWMLAGAWVGILIGEPIARWYVGLYT